VRVNATERNVMAKKIIAIIGSYRKDGIIEHAVDAILRAAAKKGPKRRRSVLSSPA